MLRAAALFLWGARGGLPAGGGLPVADSMPAGGGQTALAELRTTKKALGRYFVVGFR
jgi:hypothetical protein